MSTGILSLQVTGSVKIFLNISDRKSQIMSLGNLWNLFSLRVSIRDSEFGRYYQGFLKPKWSVSKLKISLSTHWILQDKLYFFICFLFYMYWEEAKKKKKKKLFKQFPAATCHLQQYRQTCEQIFLFQKILISNREISYAYANLFGIF